MRNRLMHFLLLAAASPVVLAGSDFGTINAADADIVAPLASTLQSPPATLNVAQYDSMWLHGGVKGQGSPIPLIEAVRALVPEVFDILIDSDINISTMVHWQSGTMTTALTEIFVQSNAKYRISEGTLLVEPLAIPLNRPHQTLAWPRFIPSAPVTVARRAPTQTKPMVSIAAVAAKKQSIPVAVPKLAPSVVALSENSNAWWVINKDEQLSTVLIAWGKKINATVAWNAGEVKSSGSMRIFSTFDSAFMQMINTVNRETNFITVSDDRAVSGRTIRITANEKNKIL